MKHCATLLFLSAISLSTMGCFSLTDKKDTPHAPTVTQAQQNLENKKKNLQSRKPSFTLPENLGGIISSDRWVVYQEKQQEEFTGHVNYDNGQYIFKADYVLSQRKKNLLTAKGNVFARCNAEEGIWYELHADQANYNYQAGNGNAKANRNKLAQLIYHTVKDELLTAYAQQAQFNTKEQTFQLDGKATLIYTNKQ